MVLVLKPSSIFFNEGDTIVNVSDDSLKTTAMAYVIFSALFCQSNTFVLERKLKGNLDDVKLFWALKKCPMAIKRKYLKLCNSSLNILRSASYGCTYLFRSRRFYYISNDGSIDRWISYAKNLER